MDAEPTKNGELVAAQPAGKDPATGKFLPGHKLSVGKGGNPWAAEMHKYRKALYESITPENVRDIAKAQIARAEKGDVKSATLVCQLLGLIVKQHDVNLTAVQVTPEEAAKRIDDFFGV